MNIPLIAVALAAAAQSAMPTVAQFNSAMSAACPEQRAATRNVRCTQPDAASIQFECRYELRGADGSWAAHTAILQLAEGDWVWIDGPTLCSNEDQLELN